MKRQVALLLAIIFIISTPVSALAVETTVPDANVPSIWAEGENGNISTINDLYIMATYYDTNFSVQSTVKQIHLENPCVKITYRCVTSDGAYDSMHLIIIDLNGNGYNKYIAIAGDGASHTVALYLPAGNYHVQFAGNVNHLKTAAAVNFKGYV